MLKAALYKVMKNYLKLEKKVLIRIANRDNQKFYYRLINNQKTLEYVRRL